MLVGGKKIVPKEKLLSCVLCWNSAGEITAASWWPGAGAETNHFCKIEMSSLQLMAFHLIFKCKVAIFKRRKVSLNCPTNQYEIVPRG